MSQRLPMIRLYLQLSSMFVALSGTIWLAPVHADETPPQVSNRQVFFTEDFEAGWGKWDTPLHDTRSLSIRFDAERAHSGRGFLSSSVKLADLLEKITFSSRAKWRFPEPKEHLYWRFYARLNQHSPPPHHWVRLIASNGTYNSRGKANVKPQGDEAATITLDLDNKGRLSFYNYWYEMRSGRCNDGSAREGCAGDQGTTYYYGNTFKPANQHALPRDQWVCIEIYAALNDVGKHNGKLILWVDDKKVGEYAQGTPEGTWLRKNFHQDGCHYKACTAPQPFEGFAFRNSEKVKFRAIELDAYYELQSFNKKRAKAISRGKRVVDRQVIEYDDVILAEKRIGCQVDDRYRETMPDL